MLDSSIFPADTKTLTEQERDQCVSKQQWHNEQNVRAALQNHDYEKAAYYIDRCKRHEAAAIAYHELRKVLGEGAK